jgi:hypothetical protein
MAVVDQTVRNPSQRFCREVKADRADLAILQVETEKR